MELILLLDLIVCIMKTLGIIGQASSNIFLNKGELVPTKANAIRLWCNNHHSKPSAGYPRPARDGNYN